MKKLTLLLLLIPIVSFGQIIVDKKLGEIDISKFEQEIIEVKGTRKFSISYGKNKRGKDEYFKVTKKTKVFDGDELIKLITLNDLIGFFTKWGYDYEGSDTRTVKNYGNGAIYNYTYSRFKNNNNEIDSNKANDNNYTTKKEKAANELKKLKELLDLDLITKEEFDKKSKELKKIILDN
ncbi:hypothetical protein OA490_01615 [Flavobacteriales bacterium]|nr:hypothetical protein [Flavobacteriales bacterium]